jgi:hypothetical protein
VMDGHAVVAGHVGESDEQRRSSGPSGGRATRFAGYLSGERSAPHQLASPRSQPPTA